MIRSIFKLVMVLFMIVSMASVCYANPKPQWEQGGITKAQAIGATAGGVTGAGVGITGSVVAVSSAGSVSGLGASGIASGLAAIGGSMIGGVVVLTAGTAIIVGAGIYGGYKLVHWYQTP